MVLHIEDERLWTDFAVCCLSECPEFQLVGIAKTGRDGIALCREKQPAIVIPDLGLRDMNGFEVLDCLSALPQPPSILLLTGSVTEGALYRVITDRIAGLIWKSEDFDCRLISALKAVAAGGTYFPPEVSEAIRRFRRSPEAFGKIHSVWERGLPSLLAQGHKGEIIATKVG